MSKQVDSGRSPVREPYEVLGYLLKHAHLALEGRTDAALAPFGITSRDLGALRVIAGGGARSQQDVAGILGVDRTSMVALLDALEETGIVARRPSEQDRRRNVIELTRAGWSPGRSRRLSPSRGTLSAFSGTKVRASFATRCGPSSVYQSQALEAARPHTGREARQRHPTARVALTSGAAAPCEEPLQPCSTQEHESAPRLTISCRSTRGGPPRRRRAKSGDRPLRG
jgi:hypothetical protein